MSDYKRGDDISSHPPPLCVCLFWLRNLLSLSFPFWYVFSDYKRRGDISSHPPPSRVCLFWLPPGCWKHGGDLEKDLAALAARLRSQRNVRVRFYYIHFKELESRYMSPIQGILVGFHIMIHIPSTTCTMMCILHYQECDVSFQTSFCDIKKFSLAMVHSSWLSWLDRRGPSGQKV